MPVMTTRREVCGVMMPSCARKSVKSMSSMGMPCMHVLTMRVRQGGVGIERRVKVFVQVMRLTGHDGLAGIGVRRERPYVARTYSVNAMVASTARRNVPEPVVPIRSDPGLFVSLPEGAIRPELCRPAVGDSPSSRLRRRRGLPTPGMPTGLPHRLAGGTTNWKPSPG